MNAAALGANGTSGVRLHQGGLHRRHVRQSRGSVNPDVDPNIVGASGIFTTAEYQANSDYQKTAAIMKLVIDGNAAAGTIEMGGFDYHTGDRIDRRSARLQSRQLHRRRASNMRRASGKPVMIYVFSDGSLASSGMIDSSAGGRGKGVWTADNQNVAATVFLGVRPEGQAARRRRANAENEPADRQFQLRTVRSTPPAVPAGNNVFNLVQMVVLNYMALHGAGASAAFPTLYPAPNLNNTLGTRHRRSIAIDRLPAAGRHRQRQDRAKSSRRRARLCRVQASAAVVVPGRHRAARSRREPQCVRDRRGAACRDQFPRMCAKSYRNQQSSSLPR